MILLDTPVILWLAMDQGKLSETAKTAIEKYAGDLWVSPISALEIGKKVAGGTLELPMSASQWFDYACRSHGLREEAFNSNVAAASTELLPIHNDPFDRVLIVTAIKKGMILLTPDRKIAQYPEVVTLW